MARFVALSDLRAYACTVASRASVLVVIVFIIKTIIALRLILTISTQCAVALAACRIIIPSLVILIIIIY